MDNVIFVVLFMCMLLLLVLLLVVCLCDGYITGVVGCCHVSCVGCVGV